MCFALQWRALFRHLNFQKWSGAEVFCTFWLGNVFRTTMACVFSTSQLPKVVRTWCVLCIFTSKCASRRNGVHFFGISTSKSGPSMVCILHFDLEICFAPRWRAAFHLSSGQGSAPAALALLFDSVLRLSYLFAHPDLLSSDFLFFDLLSSLLFSDASRLCFSAVHIVGSLTSKLPSTRCIGVIQYLPYLYLIQLFHVIPRHGCHGWSKPWHLGEHQNNCWGWMLIPPKNGIKD